MESDSRRLSQELNGSVGVSALGVAAQLMLCVHWSRLMNISPGVLSVPSLCKAFDHQP